MTETVVQEFLADRLASGLSDDVVRASFEGEFGAKISSEELAEFRLRFAELIMQHEKKLLKRIEESSLFERTLRILSKIEGLQEKAFGAEDLRALVPLLNLSKGYLELLMARAKEIKQSASKDEGKDPLSLFALLESEGVVKILDKPKLEGLLAPKMVVTFGEAKDVKKAKKEVVS